jgi:26S proteasome regulatory subunit T2
MQRIHDHLLLEEEYVENQERLRKAKAVKEGTAAPASAGGDSDALDRNADERGRVDDMRGSPMGVGTLEEMIDDDHAIVSSTTGPEYYVSIMSFVDKDLLEPGASVLLHHKTVSIVGVLTDDADPLVSVMKLDKAPTESYADIGGLESQIQEVRESVELPLLHPELYEEMGIKPPKGVILYGAPGTGKTLLAKAVANQTSATFLRIVGSELIQKYLGDGPRLVRQLFQVCDPFYHLIQIISNSYRLPQKMPHPLSLSTKLMPLVQSVMNLHQEESARSKEPCWSFSISSMVSMTVEMSKLSWPPTRLIPLILR